MLSESVFARGANATLPYTSGLVRPSRTRSSFLCISRQSNVSLPISFLNKLCIEWAPPVVIPPFVLPGAPMRNHPRFRSDIEESTEVGIAPACQPLVQVGLPSWREEIWTQRPFKRLPSVISSPIPYRQINDQPTPIDPTEEW